MKTFFFTACFQLVLICLPQAAVFSQSPGYPEFPGARSAARNARFLEQPVPGTELAFQAADICLQDSFLGYQVASPYDSNLIYHRVYRYDDQNRLIYLEYMHWDSATAAFQGDFKQIRAFYGASTQLYDSTEYYTWDLATMDWKGSSKANYTYNAIDSLHWQTVFQWGAAYHSWTPYYRTETTYNTQNRKEKTVLEIMNATSGVWTYSSRTDFTYDLAGKLAQTDQYIYSGNAWKPQYRDLYQYNAPGNLVSILKQSPVSNGGWTNYHKTTYDYANPQQPWTDQRDYVWVSAVQSWVDDRWMHRAYDSQNRQTEFSSYRWRNNRWEGSGSSRFTASPDGSTMEYSYWEWDTLAATWIGSFKDVYHLNGQGRTQTAETFTWLSLPDHWSPEYRFFYHYDSSGYLSGAAREDYYPNTGQWKFWGNDYLFYSCITIPTQEVSAKAALSVYPNPAHGTLQIRGETSTGSTVSIFATDGRLIRRIQLAAGENTIDLDGIDPGVYILSILCGNQYYIPAKIVVE